MSPMLTTVCPLCGAKPMFGGLFTPFFCPTDGCKVLSWNPERSIDDNMNDLKFVDLSAFVEPSPEDGVITQPTKEDS